MRRLTLGTIIARRELRYDDADRGEHPVEVLIGLPFESVAGSEWSCPWQIVGLGNEEIRTGHGIDAFQALQIAMKMIGVNLYVRSDKGSRLRWLDSGPGDCGFPWE